MLRLHVAVNVKIQKNHRYICFPLPSPVNRMVLVSGKKTIVKHAGTTIPTTREKRICTNVSKKPGWQSGHATGCSPEVQTLAQLCSNLGPGSIIPFLREGRFPKENLFKSASDTLVLCAGGIVFVTDNTFPYSVLLSGSRCRSVHAIDHYLERRPPSLCCLGTRVLAPDIPAPSNVQHGRMTWSEKDMNDEWQVERR